MANYRVLTTHVDRSVLRSDFELFFHDVRVVWRANINEIGGEAPPVVEDALGLVAVAFSSLNVELMSRIFEEGQVAAQFHQTVFLFFQGNSPVQWCRCLELAKRALSMNNCSSSTFADYLYVKSIIVDNQTTRDVMIVDVTEQASDNASDYKAGADDANRDNG